ncbi:MAG: hypothetical protein H6739_36780 [Alphaproteobacteria bacterium]|nr:hypothetical protein [Alphaproteobacteria bacterium]
MSRWDDHQFDLRKGDLNWRVHTTVERPICYIVDFSSWTLPRVAEAMVAGHGVGMELFGFLYDTDLDEEDDEDPFVGVQIYDPDEEVVLSHADFDDLMLRVFDAWIVSTDQHHLDREPWWPDFLRDVETIRARAAARG